MAPHTPSTEVIDTRRAKCMAYREPGTYIIHLQIGSMHKPRDYIDIAKCYVRKLIA